MDLQKAFEINRKTWNKKVAVHAKSDFYKLEEFKKGATSLNKFELDALGNISGKSLLHLQCHFGQDTLSLTRMGAKCTGVDISDAGIELAQELSKELNLDAEFICCNVLDASQHLKSQFDIVFTSYGVIGWLPDLKPWAQLIAERLKSGGFFYMVEFHPIAWMFDYTEIPATMKYGYNQQEAIYEEYKGTYADDTEDKMISKEYGWNHGLSEVINSLLEAGLQLEFFREYEESPYDVFPGLVKSKKGLYKLENGLYPLVYEVKFFKV